MNTKNNQTPSEAPDGSHSACDELLAPIWDEVDIPSLVESWAKRGWTTEMASAAKAAYEDWSNEKLSFGDVEAGVHERAESNERFIQRVVHFFVGWKASHQSSVSSEKWADHYHQRLVEARKQGLLPHDFSF